MIGKRAEKPTASIKGVGANEGMTGASGAGRTESALVANDISADEGRGILRGESMEIVSLNSKWGGAVVGQVD
jgi:hypothetical protein